MALSDVLADVLTRIRNGQMAKLPFVTVHSSKLVKSVLKVLHQEGYISQFEELEDRKGVNFIKVALKYHDGNPVIAMIKRVSTPGRRSYTKVADLQKVYGGLGIGVLSTSKGVVSDHEAKQLNAGGEVLCYVY
ncbi:30S ribosomal protein S8 [Rickettsiales endosymbiont of Peranema trichophorum]|uniref:30S ribosomal protein S8 n=1 Tax=Rickettsiales endosymbiont of Peranema trichophorum TaxID=2486577 RepID=UPI001022DB82|nr:30S ribosomal protein S8 [Rickettsiales endosymbiont of Peranema trichophorum]RZI45572.1 30S ribosomal protein S8 [Rickettsiales endosymbiont of Peranema trichophorum]